MAKAITQWSKWFLLFVKADRLDVANLLAAQWDPDDGSPTFGSVKLSPDGNLPITHYGTSTPATESMRDGITAALGVTPWAAMYWTDDIYPDEGLVQWQGPDEWEFEGLHGDVYLAWMAALDDMGLRLYQEQGP